VSELVRHKPNPYGSANGKSTEAFVPSRRAASLDNLSQPLSPSHSTECSRQKELSSVETIRNGDGVEVMRMGRRSHLPISSSISPA
jgi:hypothetical protein